MLDRFGSMEGANWHQSVKALHQIVAGLDDDDLVWLTCFESDYQDFAERPLPAAALRTDPNFQAPEEIGTGGGTNLLPALEHLLDHIDHFNNSKLVEDADSPESAAVRRNNLILITDGQVGNEQEILRKMETRSRSADRLPVHAVGIDTAVNDAFLRSLGRITGGSCQLPTPNDNLTRGLTGLGARLQTPILLDLRVSGNWTAPGGGLPDLHAGESLFVTLAHPDPEAIATAPLKITALDPATNTRRHLDLKTAVIESSAPRLLHIREEIKTLLQSGKEKQATDLAIRTGITCPGTSFIAIDDAEKVPVSTRALSFTSRP